MKIGFFGSCQLHLCSNFFINTEMKKKYNIEIVFNMAFYEYDFNYKKKCKKIDYNIFNKIDYLIIENNNLNISNQASSQKIISYCQNKNIKIIKTFLLKFPIYPINWSGYGENKKDYINWTDLNKINYKEKFNKCIKSCKLENEKSDLDINLTKFIEDNFNKKLLFTHSLHPTNILLYELWKYILQNININITDYKYDFSKELIDCWNNPFTTKMIKDLNIQFKCIVSDDFYIKRYNKNKNSINKIAEKINIT